MSLAVPLPTLTPRGAYYVGNGDRFVRVTSVCAVLGKPHLAVWRGKVGNAEADRILAEAVAFGTRLHAAAQTYLEHFGALDRGPWLATQADDLRLSLDVLTTWLAAHVRAVVGVERLLVSRRYGYAGTTDLVCELTDGTLAILDWKSSKAYPAAAPRPDLTWCLQTAAYQAALAEQDGLSAPRRLIVQLPRDQPGALFVHDFLPATSAADWLTFRSLLHCYQWQSKQNGVEHA